MHSRSSLRMPSFASHCASSLRNSFRPTPISRTRDHVRALCAAVSGLLVCALALWIVALAWPGTRWTGTLSDLTSPARLTYASIHNGIVIMASYFAIAGMIWGLSDAIMRQPHDLQLTSKSSKGRIWRVAHLSDIHVVGERFGFRIEGGRSGPSGNERFKQLLAKLDAIHALQPLDLILITGDITDAGRGIRMGGVH